MNPTSINIALISPDGLSTVLFCKQIIKTLLSTKKSNLYVIADLGKYKEEIESLGVHCIDIPMYRWFNPVKDFIYFFRLKKELKNNHIEVVFTFTTKPNIYGVLSASLTRNIKKIFMHIVGLGNGFSSATNWHNKIVRFIFLKLYYFAFNKSDKIWFTNENDRNYFIELGVLSKSKTVLSKNYLNPDEYSEDLIDEHRKNIARKTCNLAEGEKLVIMVGRLIWEKGIKEFTEAAVLLNKENPNIKFVLIAPPEIISNDTVPESYVKSFESLANFKWIGFQEDVKSFYSISNLAVLPTYYKEGGYPRALLEPMAMNKPVITTTSKDCCGAVEDGKNGFLIPPMNSKALAEAIYKILNDDDLIDKFGEYSRLKVLRDFDERTIVRDAIQEMGVLDS